MPPLSFNCVSKMYRTPSAGERWVLRDISFECQEGEIVAIIGRNGSGKSTCLKLAAGVTAPTGGSVSCARPLAPMLELGAGFHPDLTGRENIQLNATFLGLGRKIDRRLFDAIVAFAELEAHVDDRVKHYSSGMYARLGFAVAVHSPARVLLIDEVLAVGDSSFRQKCFDRILRLRDRGTTILFVSHDAGAVRQLCSRAIVLDGARIAADGDPESALHLYDWQLRAPHPQGTEEGT